MEKYFFHGNVIYESKAPVNNYFNFYSLLGAIELCLCCGWKQVVMKV